MREPQIRKEEGHTEKKKKILKTSLEASEENF